jgi:hypothetical protein
MYRQRSLLHRWRRRYLSDQPEVLRRPMHPQRHLLHRWRRGYLPGESEVLRR